MKTSNLYVLPNLPYDYKALAPYMSEEILHLHHDKHHLGYVNAANALLGKLEQAREANADADIKNISKELSFNIGGHVLHCLFWENLRPAQDNPNVPKDAILKTLESEYGSFERFKMEFTKAAVTTEGSGWAALSYCTMLKRPIIMQLEKHNLFVNPSFAILLTLDVWEHSYYLDYKNDRAKFVEAFWNIVNWDKVNERLTKLCGCTAESKTA